jgi:hypothetical protein
MHLARMLQYLARGPTRSAMGRLSLPTRVYPGDEGVEEVRRLDAKCLHWAASIGGTPKEWGAKITKETLGDWLGLVSRRVEGDLER